MSCWRRRHPDRDAHDARSRIWTWTPTSWPSSTGPAAWAPTRRGTRAAEVARRPRAGRRRRAATPSRRPRRRRHRVGAALSSFCFFAAGALIPVLPFLFGMTGMAAVLVAAVLVGAALLLTGAIVGMLSGGPPLRRALRQLAIGSAPPP